MAEKDAKAQPFVRQATGLTKPISSFDLFTFALAWSIGSGILFFTVGIVNSYPGSNPFMSLLIDAVMLFPAGGVLYLLGVGLPRVGGQYVWISRFLHPAIGYFMAIVVWLGYSLIMGDVASVGASFLAQSFTIAGHILHSVSLTSAGAVFSEPYVRILVASVLVLFFTGLTSIGYRSSRISIYVFWWVPLAVLVLSVAGMLFTSPTAAPSLWDKVFGAGSYQTVLAQSTAKGWKPSLIAPSIGATLLASIPLISSWSGWSHIGGWMAGEVRYPKRALFFGTIGAGLFAMLLMALVIYSYQHLFGLEFVSRLGLVASALKITPSIPLFAAVAFGGLAPVAVLIGFLTFIFPIKDVLPSLVAQSRQLFAAAFDRLLPQSLTRVNSRTGQPLIAHLVTAAAIIVSVFFVTAPIVPLGLYIGSDLYVLSVALLQVFTAMAAIVFPISSPELYRAAPRPASLEVGRIPLISIVGSISLAAWLFLLGDDFYGIFSSPVGYIVSAIIAVIMACVFLLYTYYVKGLEKEGVNIGAVGREIPPE
jgi:amino acid transporter